MPNTVPQAWINTALRFRRAFFLVIFREFERAHLWVTWRCRCHCSRASIRSMNLGWDSDRSFLTYSQVPFLVENVQFLRLLNPTWNTPQPSPSIAWRFGSWTSIQYLLRHGLAIVAAVALGSQFEWGIIFSPFAQAVAGRSLAAVGDNARFHGHSAGSTRLFIQHLCAEVDSCHVQVKWLSVCTGSA